MGFRPEELGTIKKAARLAQGLILVTGPTGSGKTTTLHAVINQINDPDVNIVTLEDPVEQAIPGANHVQIAEKAGLTFPIALRSVLRRGVLHRDEGGINGASGAFNLAYQWHRRDL